MKFLVLAVGAILVSCAEKSISDDENAIRTARALSNKAIAEHDSLAIANAWMDNFLILTSRDYQSEGKEINRKSLSSEFTTKEDVIYIRTPLSIEVMETWGMASETGTWEGSWLAEDSKIEIGGTYYAKWHKVDNKWLLRAEVYTPTHCKGGSYCERLNN